MFLVCCKRCNRTICIHIKNMNCVKICASRIVCIIFCCFIISCFCTFIHALYHFWFFFLWFWYCWIYTQFSIQFTNQLFEFVFWTRICWCNKIQDIFWGFECICLHNLFYFAIFSCFVWWSKINFKINAITSVSQCCSVCFGK